MCINILNHNQEIIKTEKKMSTTPATRKRNPSSPPFNTATHEIQPKEKIMKAIISSTT